jgi:predicted nucleotidyltransferase
MDDKQTLAPIKDDIRRFYESIREVMPVKNVFLYGSYAKGTAQSSSDIDVGVILDIQDRSQKIRYNSLMFRYAMNINPDIEPFCITIDEWKNREPASILNEISKTAILIAGTSA